MAVRFPIGKMVIVLLSGDQDGDHENVGEKESELLTEVLFIETMNEMIMDVLRGLSWPIGEWETTTGKMNVLNSHEKLLPIGVPVSDKAPARTVIL